MFDVEIDEDQVFIGIGCKKSQSVYVVRAEPTSGNLLYDTSPILKRFKRRKSPTTLMMPYE